MKRLVLLGMALVLSLGLAACGTAKKSGEPKGSSAKETSETAKFNRAATGKLITPVDAELATGIAAIHLVKPDAEKGATGDVNYVDGDNRLVFIVDYGDKKWFEQQKASPIFLEPVDGIGDDAFFGPSKQISDFVYQIAFVKGDTAGVISSFYTPDRKESLLTRAQLEELAQRAVKKL